MCVLMSCDFVLLKAVRSVLWRQLLFALYAGLHLVFHPQVLP